jgi:hypothetical protein
MSKHSASLERVKFFARVDPADAERFRAVRAALMAAERRRVMDAEVFRLAMRGLLEAVPAHVRKAVDTRRRTR